MLQPQSSSLPTKIMITIVISGEEAVAIINKLIMIITSGEEAVVIRSLGDAIEAVMLDGVIRISKVEIRITSTITVVVIRAVALGVVAMVVPTAEVPTVVAVLRGATTL